MNQSVRSAPAALTLKAPAKINLFLKVLNRRPDGYHEIQSFMQKIALFDILHLSQGDEGISLSCPGGAVPEGRDNLVYRAAEAFCRAAGISPGFKLVLEKNIPVAAGLGGGSSDAAAVLTGLNSLSGATLDAGKLHEIGLALGADVPFFLHPGSGVLATGIGADFLPVEPLQDYWIVLVNPGFALSTKWVYENFPLTSCSNPYILAPDLEGPGKFPAVPPESLEEIGNDLETVSIGRFAEIGDIKKELKKTGAVAALMSGSGPTVYGLFPGREEAQSSFTRFARIYGDKVFLVRPYNP